MTAQERYPFMKKIGRIAAFFAKQLNGATSNEVLDKSTKEKKQTEPCVGNDDFGKYCVSMFTTIAIDTLDTMCGNSTFHEMEINQCSAIIIMDMTGASGPTDGTGL